MWQFERKRADWQSDIEWERELERLINEVKGYIQALQDTSTISIGDGKHSGAKEEFRNLSRGLNVRD